MEWLSWSYFKVICKKLLCHQFISRVNYATFSETYHKPHNYYYYYYYYYLDTLFIPNHLCAVGIAPGGSVRRTEEGKKKKTERERERMTEHFTPICKMFGVNYYSIPNNCTYISRFSVIIVYFIVFS
jgi:hypothetical protein